MSHNDRTTEHTFNSLVIVRNLHNRYKFYRGPRLVLSQSC